MIEPQKPKEEMSKEEHFKKVMEDVKRAQNSAMINGGAIVVAMLIFWFLVPPEDLVGFFLYAAIFVGVFFLTMYFVWSQEQVCWGVKPREGYTVALTIGNVLWGFLNCPKGKAFTKDWDVVPYDHPGAMKQFSLGGMYFIPLWPFVKVFWQKTEWERYYPSAKLSVLKRELLREFSLLPYPQYVGVEDAEDMNRLGTSLFTNVIVEIVNPKKALFNLTTPWIDVVKPLIQGAYVSYIKGTTFQEMIKMKEDIGNDILRKMKDPTGRYNSLVEMLEKVYGIRILSISVIDIVGSDTEEQKAIRAKALAELNRDAALITADANSRRWAVEIIGLAIKMLVQLVAPIKLDPQEQQNQYLETENEIKRLIKDEPEEFKRKYGEVFNRCLDFVQRKMALEAGSLVDVRSPDSKGGVPDLLTVITTAKMLDKSGIPEAKKEEKEAAEECLQH